MGPPRSSKESHHTSRPSRPWWIWVIAGGLISCALAIGFMIPLIICLDRQVVARFGELRWQIPTRVYARPLTLTLDQTIDVATLRVELLAAAYREDVDGQQAGTFAQYGQRFVIASHGYTDVDGLVPPRRVEVIFADNKVVALHDMSDQQTLAKVRLDPARIATLYGQKQEERRLVRLDEVSPLLIAGLQAVEDRSFKSHHGIDPSGMLRALWVIIKSHGDVVQGASTLTQQLARSGLLGIGKEHTALRKLKEMIYALSIEAHYDKQTILEAYLNQVYLGQRGLQAVHGVGSGAEFWFGQDLQSLTTDQIALLIGLVKGPSYYDPRRFPNRAQQRRNFVLSRLHEAHLLDDHQYQTAVMQPLSVPKEPGLIAADRFPAYIDLARRQLADDYPEEALRGAGMSVLTGMSPSVQAYTEGAMKRTLQQLDHGKRTAKTATLQAGAVVTDTHNGDVLAVIGSREPAKPGFNRAIDAQRPVGSLLKPFVYLLALASPEQWSLASWVEDTPMPIQLPRGRLWSPSNSDNQSHGTVRLLDALANSYNQATVRVGMQITPDRLAQLIHVLAGIHADVNPALILGATEQSPYTMAQLYQFLASGGQIQSLHAVRGVLDPHGRLLRRYDKTPAPAQEGDSIAANLINIGLQHVVSDGTGKRLIADGLGYLHLAGKTGTTNDGRDSWFAGYTGDHLAVIWIGNDQNAQTGLFGATGAMRLWSTLFLRLPSAPLQVNEKGIDWQWIEKNGNHSTASSCPDAVRYPFVVGFAPAYAPCNQDDEQQKGWRNWRSWFGLDHDAPAPESPPPPKTE